MIDTHHAMAPAYVFIGDRLIAKPLDCSVDEGWVEVFAPKREDGTYEMNGEGKPKRLRIEGPVWIVPRVTAEQWRRRVPALLNEMLKRKSHDSRNNA